MVVIEDFEIQLVHAGTRVPFKEHVVNDSNNISCGGGGGRGGGVASCYVEAVPGEDFFVGIRKVRSTSAPLYCKYFVDGRDLQYYDSSDASRVERWPRLRGILTRVDGRAHNRAFRFSSGPDGGAEGAGGRSGCGVVPRPPLASSRPAAAADPHASTVQVDVFTSQYAGKLSETNYFTHFTPNESSNSCCRIDGGIVGGGGSILRSEGGTHTVSETAAPFVASFVPGAYRYSIVLRYQTEADLVAGGIVLRPPPPFPVHQLPAEAAAVAAVATTTSIVPVPIFSPTGSSSHSWNSGEIDGNRHHRHHHQQQQQQSQQPSRNGGRWVQSYSYSYSNNANTVPAFQPQQQQQQQQQNSSSQHNLQQQRGAYIQQQRNSNYSSNYRGYHRGDGRHFCGVPNNNGDHRHRRTVPDAASEGGRRRQVERSQVAAVVPKRGGRPQRANDRSMGGKRAGEGRNKIEPLVTTDGGGLSKGDSKKESRVDRSKAESGAKVKNDEVTEERGEEGDEIAAKKPPPPRRAASKKQPQQQQQQQHQNQNQNQNQNAAATVAKKAAKSSTAPSTELADSTNRLNNSTGSSSGNNSNSSNYYTRNRRSNHHRPQQQQQQQQQRMGRL